MKKYLLPFALCIPLVAVAQGPVYQNIPETNSSTLHIPLASELPAIPKIRPFAITPKVVDHQLPDHWNTAEQSYFPPIFSQEGGSCGVASHVGYMLTSEMNAYEGADGKLLENQLPPNFEFAFTYNGPGKDEMALYVGFPDSKIYGGRTYSKKYGLFSETTDDFSWVQGYNIFYNAMHHRLAYANNFPALDSPYGQKVLKAYLYNHAGDPQFKGRGGTVCVGVGIGGVATAAIPNSEQNKALDVVGKQYLQHWRIGDKIENPGTGVGTRVTQNGISDHALTIVGYDDRIEFDLDHNGKVGETENELGQNERGAWIIANTWGYWGNKGFIYVPYAMAGPVSYGVLNSKNETCYKVPNYWTPYVYHYRCGYRPLRTLKATVSYIGRSEISVKVGISRDLDATQPEKIITFPYINETGDNIKDGKEARTPMLGKWADGRLHYEPMEFGVDATDLSDNYDLTQPLKYFFIIDTKDNAKGIGGIHAASMIDYSLDPNGAEVPFTFQGDTLKIEGKGQRTLLSTIMPGNQLFAPSNVHISDQLLTWNLLNRSVLPVKGYNVYKDGNLIQFIAGERTQQFAITEPGKYAVSTVYQTSTGEMVSNISKEALLIPADKQAIFLNNNGFSIPQVCKQPQPTFTIEYWLKPSRISNWNQQIGLGWGTFLAHANANGNLSIGWNTNSGDRIDVPNAYKVGEWRHYAFVINQNNIKVFINGKFVKEHTSKKYSGMPKLTPFNFGGNGGDNRMSGEIDEVRIWNSARTNEEIAANYNRGLANPKNDPHLLAYYKMSTFTKNHQIYLQDYTAHENHAPLVYNTFTPTTNDSIKEPELTLTIDSIFVPKRITMLRPATFSAIYTGNVVKTEWSATHANPAQSTCLSPSFVFLQPGKSTVTLKISNQQGESYTASQEVEVLPAPTVTAAFHITPAQIKTNQQISFSACNTSPNCTYKWEMEGATTTSATTPIATTSYNSNGNYLVTLTVTDPTGKVFTEQKTIHVNKSTPEANFDISPSIVIVGDKIHLQDKSKYDPTEARWRFTSPYFERQFNGKDLTETATTPGIYHLDYIAGNEAGQQAVHTDRALIVCAYDAGNALTLSGAKALKANIGEDQNKDFTLEWWMKPLSTQSNTNGIYLLGKEKKVGIHCKDEHTVTFDINGDTKDYNGDWIINDEWHHYAISGSADTHQLIFYRDGQEINSYTTQNDFSSQLLGSLNIGKCQATDAPAQSTFDEIRVWKRALTAPEIFETSRKPIQDIAAAQQNGLVLYFDCNQDEGDVIDRVSNTIKGIRINPGPSGDAWGRANGVYALPLTTPEYPKAEAQGEQLSNKNLAVTSVSDEEINAEYAPAEYALDGNTDTFWHSTWKPEKPYPHTIDLWRNALDQIKSMRILATRGNQYKPCAVSVYQSKDQEHWELIDEAIALPYQEHWAEIIFSKPITQPYLRISFTQNFTKGKLMAIQELQFYGEAHHSSLVARPLSFVSASGENGNLAIDGQTTSQWTSTLTNENKHQITLQVNDGQPFDLLHINAIVNSTAAKTKLNLLASNGGEHFVPVANNLRLRHNDATVVLPRPIRAKFIQLEFIQNDITYNKEHEPQPNVQTRQLKVGEIAAWATEAAQKELPFSTKTYHQKVVATDSTLITALCTQREVLNTKQLPPAHLSTFIRFDHFEETLSTITAVFKEKLPFTASTAKSQHWYLLTLSGNKYVTGSDNATTGCPIQATSTFAPEEFWSFEGNSHDGFRLRNFAYPQQYLHLDNFNNGTPAYCSSEPTLFQLTATKNGFYLGKNNTGNCCLNNYGDKDYLKIWQSGNEGSRLNAVDPELHQRFADIFTPMMTGDLHPFELSADARRTLQADFNRCQEHCELGDYLNFKQKVEHEIAAKHIYYPESGYYRISNHWGKNRYMVGNTNRVEIAEQNHGPESVIYFEQKDATPRYTLKMQNATIQAPQNDRTELQTDGEPTYEAEYVKFGVGAFKIANTNNYLNLQDVTNSVVRWEKDMRSYWVVEQAHDFDIALHQAGNKAYATLYVPFACSPMNDAVKAYYGTINSERNAVILHELKVIPAGCPVVIIADDPQLRKVGFQIVEGNYPTPEGFLTGTYLEKAPQNDYYYLGSSQGIAGFYHWKTTKKLHANRAYLTTENMKALSAALPFSFDTTTGINQVTADTKDLPIFNLQGQRVQKMQPHHIYIIQGKKVLCE